MYDSIAAWMIAGGVRSETADRNLSHLVAIREASLAVAARPGLLDRFRARLGTPSQNAAPAVDCCAA
jgi:hypothetical protein